MKREHFLYLGLAGLALIVAACSTTDDAPAGDVVSE